MSVLRKTSSCSPLCSNLSPRPQSASRCLTTFRLQRHAAGDQISWPGDKKHPAPLVEPSEVGTFSNHSKRYYTPYAPAIFCNSSDVSKRPCTASCKLSDNDA